MTLPHGDVCTPVYMPVGTKGTIKGLTSQQMDNLGCKLMLGNTYHLANKPGSELISKFGGLHKFMNWKNNLLTDSGGFQMVSLSKLCEVDETGVKFENPYDGSQMEMRPEDSIIIQGKIGADIMMALDDVVRTTSDLSQVKSACERTIRWIDRNISAQQNIETQNLFPIVQGALDPELRKLCVEELVKKDMPGYAIGGLAGGESKEDFWKVVHLCTSLLPEDKPRYLMGVGYPVDLIVCSCLGADMFDCVFPMRTARFGNAFTKYGFMKVRNSEMATDFRPIEEGCQCLACKHYTRAYIHMLINKEEVACHLLTIHNIHYLLTLMKEFHNSILEERLESFVCEFLENYFCHEKEIPGWVSEALIAAGLNISPKFEDNEENMKTN